MSEEAAVSPRTPTRPMAFRTEEFVRGAMLAWGLSLLLLPGLLFATLSTVGCPTFTPSPSCSTLDVSSRLVGAVMLALVGAVASIPTFLLFVFPAYGLNRAWERVAHPAAHIAVNALLGLAVGAAGSLGAFAALGIVGLFALSLPVVLGSALAGAIAFPIAWRLTAARAVNTDRGISSRCAWRFPDGASTTDSEPRHSVDRF